MKRLRFKLSFLISRVVLAGWRRAYRSRPSSLRCSPSKTQVDQEVASFIEAAPKQKKQGKHHHHRSVGFAYTCCHHEDVVLPVPAQRAAIANENFWSGPVSQRDDAGTTSRKDGTFVEENGGGVLEGRRAPANSDVSGLLVPPSGLLVAPVKQRKKKRRSRSSSSNSRVGSSSFCVTSTSSSGGELDDEPLFGSDAASSCRQWEARSEQFTTTDVDGVSLHSSSSSSSSGSKNRRNRPSKWEKRKFSKVESRSKRWEAEEPLYSSASATTRSTKSNNSRRKGIMKLGCGASPQIVSNTDVKGGVPVMMLSRDPYEDFRQSMLHMISERGISRLDELQDLLDCYLRLNSPNFHRVILQAFSDLVRP